MADEPQDRKAAYAAWRERLRHENEDIIDLDAEEEQEEPWSPEALFRLSSTVNDES